MEPIINPWIVYVINMFDNVYPVLSIMIVVLAIQIILSSPKINEPVECKYDFVDKIFTVYDKKYIKKHNIEINCGGEQCLTCGKCYCKSKVKNINEMLK